MDSTRIIFFYISALCAKAQCAKIVEYYNKRIGDEKMIKNYLAKEKTNSYSPKPWDWSETPFPAFRGESHSYTTFLAVASGYKCVWETHPRGWVSSDDKIKLYKKYYPNPQQFQGDFGRPENKFLVFDHALDSGVGVYNIYPFIDDCSVEFIKEYELLKNLPVSPYLETGKPLVDTKCSKIITTAKGTLLVVPCQKEEDEKIMLITALSGFRGFFSNISAVACEIIYQRNAQKHCVETAHIVARIGSGGYVWTETGRRGSSGDVEIFSWDSYQRMPKEEFLVWQEIQKNR